MRLKIIKCKYGYESVLAGPTTVTHDWLSLQTVPFADDAIFHIAYPLTGGSVVVDLNNIAVLRWMTPEDLHQFGEHLPHTACDAVRTMAETPVDVIYMSSNNLKTIQMLEFSQEMILAQISESKAIVDTKQFIVIHSNDGTLTAIHYEGAMFQGVFIGPTNQYLLGVLI